MSRWLQIAAKRPNRCLSRLVHDLYPYKLAETLMFNVGWKYLHFSWLQLDVVSLVSHAAHSGCQSCFFASRSPQSKATDCCHHECKEHKHSKAKRLPKSRELTLNNSEIKFLQTVCRGLILVASIRSKASAMSTDHNLDKHCTNLVQDAFA